MTSTMKDDIVVNASPIVNQYMPATKPAAGSKGKDKGKGKGKAENDTGATAKLPNKKQMILQQNFEFKRKYESMVLEWIEILCDTVSEDVLGEADIKGKFRISRQEQKVFDISALKLYCSSTCLAASRWFENQLTDHPLYLTTTDPEELKVSRVTIVPLDMELAEFHALRMNKTTAAAKNSQGHVTNGTSSTPSNTEAYVQSLMASVPTTPSSIKIVERDMQEVLPGDPLDMSDMQMDVQSAFGGNHSQGHYETVEGFRVPVASSTHNKHNLLKSMPKKFQYGANEVASRLEDLTLSDDRQYQKSKLFIGGLSWNTTNESLRDGFAAYGEVVDAIVIRDRETGRSRGFGFVTFSTDNESQNAIDNLNDQEFDGRTIKVDRASERAPSAPRTGGYAPRPNRGGYNGGGYGGYQSQGQQGRSDGDWGRN
ncbi:hypothetical protein BGZ94_009556 [Podila epigama]|nr:hypothetical protein BGZ94_009556 [Podila epigama]